MLSYRYQYENDDATNHKLTIFSNDGKIIVSGLNLSQAAKICSTLNALAIRLEDSKIAEARYEKVRKMTPDDFKDIYSYNIFYGVHFDKLIDTLYGDYNG